MRAIPVSISLILFSVCCCTGRTMWYLWVGAGSGNANFFYFQTLLFGASQAFVLLDALMAARKAVYLRVCPDAEQLAAHQQNVDDGTNKSGNKAGPVQKGDLIDESKTVAQDASQ
jgi:hypothetical protein